VSAPHYRQPVRDSQDTFPWVFLVDP
jgi:hypothetical protein